MSDNQEQQITNDSPQVQEDPGAVQPDKSPDSEQVPSNDNLPEKFKGKSAEDIAKSYLELEKKLGEQSSIVQEYNKTKKLVDDWEELLLNNPDVYDVAMKAKNKSQEPKREEKIDGREVKSQPSESDQYIRNQALSNFERNYLSSFDDDKKKDLYEKTARKFMDLRDPGGTKDFLTTVKETPLRVLESTLSDAFFLATRDAAIPSSDKDFASVGNMPSSTRKSDSNSLTDDEKAAAKIFGMSEDDYKKYKNK